MNIKEQLLEIPKKIKDLEILAIVNSESLEDLIKDLKQKELELIDDIANEVDDKGKAVFSNAEKRKAELDRRKGEDFKHFEEQIAKAKYRINELRIDISYYSNLQQNLRVIASLQD